MTIGRKSFGVLEESQRPMAKVLHEREKKTVNNPEKQVTFKITFVSRLS